MRTILDTFCSEPFCSFLDSGASPTRAVSPRSSGNTGNFRQDLHLCSAPAVQSPGKCGQISSTLTLNSSTFY